MSSVVLLSLPPIFGYAYTSTQKATGLLAPAILSREPSGDGRARFTLGVTHDTMVIEIIPIAERVGEATARTLGYRWLWFVTALFERNIVLSEELAREAWFAANREPLDFNRAATHRGIGVMRHHLGILRANEIREMSTPPA